MNRYLVEFIGTFFLFLTSGTTVTLGAPGVIPPVAIGLALAVMIYAGGHISGAHYNPAVTLAVTLRGAAKMGDMLPYMLFQFIGGAAGALVAKYLTGKPLAAAAPFPALGPVFVAELLFAFALCWVVLNAATAKANQGNSFYGLAIGGTVLVGAFTVGPISGGAFNPAVVVGAMIQGLLPVSQAWVHMVADFAGGALAAVAFKSLSAQDS